MTDSDTDERRWPHWVAFACILALAVALRVAGLRWGLPNELHSYSYHPDEFLTVGSSATMAGLVDGHRTINPGLYNYPSLYLYMSALAMMVGSGYGWLGSSANVYLAARIVTVLMSVGAVGATYWAGRVLFGNAAGLLAALIIAIAPLHVQHSHFATVDVPSTLFVALCLGFSGLILKRGSRRDYILAGVMAGLACGTKYNAVLVILAPIAAHFMSQAPSLRTNVPPLRLSALRPLLSANLWLIPLCAIAAFIISTPGSVLYTRQFLHGISYEMQHQAAGHGLVFAGTGNGFVYTLTSSLLYGLSPFLVIAFVLAVIYGLIKRDSRVLTILAFVLPYYVLISASQVRFARYTLPLFPAIALMIGWLIPEWIRALSDRRPPLVITRGVWVVFAAGAICCGLFYNMFVNGSLVLPVLAPLFVSHVPDDAFASPQDRAARWLKSHIKAGDTLGLLDYPWYYSPPLNNKIALDILPQRKAAITHTPYRITVFSEPANRDWYTRKPPHWIVVSDEEFIDAVRLRGVRGLRPADQAAVERINRDLAVIAEHYAARGGFGEGLYEIWDMGTPPHDMRYTDPAGIRIYELKP